MTRLDPSHTALLLIDMQHGFLSPGGSVARIGFPVGLLAPAVPACARLLAAARRQGMPIAHTRYVFEPGLTDGGVMVDDMLPELRRERALVRGSADADIIPDLAPAPGERVFDKNRPSACLNTGLEAWLQAGGIRQVIVAGVTTSVCVETSVRDLAQRDWRVIIAEDAVAEYDAERHAVALKTLGLLFARRMMTAEIIAAMEDADAAA
ncbi:cysteine hydrolase family protein [Sandaracinobacteroides saxicola]|uniref:Cysteine hydrolase n=1 Tax=Sandaracinobacteroides saxicola TaxID=2759707 RepID=A0A7G5IIA2_9SPHN|nr:cysteine hydrolase [Sandaracinobacteroides saxicola]QMW23094.1 cysteine hydrolase [Sandaracinobacteroides saxicola]